MIAESRAVAIPQIDAELCVLSRFDVSTCSACVEACPSKALTTGEDGLELDAAACSGCGGCGAACPSGAVTLDGAECPEPLSRPGAEGWLACSRHAQGKGGDALCLQALGLAALARLWLQGLRRITCLTGDCAACPDGAGLSVHRHVAALNALLASRKLPGLLLERAGEPPRRTTRIGPGAATDAGRRRLFGLSALPMGAASAPPLARLQSLSWGPDTLYVNVPLIDPGRCTGCDACISLCPTASLSRVKSGDGEMQYVVDPATCNDCGLCCDLCGENAIRLGHLSAAPQPVALACFRCRGCGVNVHVPALGPYAARGICPVCDRTGHHKRLFQVLE